MLQGRCHLRGHELARYKYLASIPGGLLHLGHPNKLAQQGRARSLELSAALNPGRVWERGTGKGEEEEKGARSQQNIILGYILSPWQLLGNLTGSELPSTK